MDYWMFVRFENSVESCSLRKYCRHRRFGLKKVLNLLEIEYFNKKKAD